MKKHAIFLNQFYEKLILYIYSTPISSTFGRNTLPRASSVQSRSATTFPTRHTKPDNLIFTDPNNFEPDPDPALIWPQYREQNQILLIFIPFNVVTYYPITLKKKFSHSKLWYVLLSKDSDSVFIRIRIWLFEKFRIRNTDNLLKIFFWKEEIFTVPVENIILEKRGAGQKYLSFRQYTPLARNTA